MSPLSLDMDIVFDAQTGLIKVRHGITQKRTKKKDINLHKSISYVSRHTCQKAKSTRWINQFIYWIWRECPNVWNSNYSSNLMNTNTCKCSPSRIQKMTLSYLLIVRLITSYQELLRYLSLSRKFHTAFPQNKV